MGLVRYPSMPQAPRCSNSGDECRATLQSHPAMRQLMQSDIRIGLDTGGTYTDAVALDHQGRVVTSAKALTTHWDLSVGLGNAIRAVLSGLPGGAGRGDISLVSVSTTLEIGRAHV